MLVETGKKIFYLSPDTGKESGNISTPVNTTRFLWPLQDAVGRSLDCSLSFSWSEGRDRQPMRQGRIGHPYDEAKVNLAKFCLSVCFFFFFFRSATTLMSVTTARMAAAQFIPPVLTHR